jgi:sugar/nucleoside kinase (ribokinase family)
MINRLVSLGNVIIEIVAEVPALPERSDDVLASGVALEVGGGFNLMATAARQGLDVAYAGALGHGLFSDLARRELRAVGIALLLPDAPGEQRDTGFEPTDALLISGYGLLHDANRHAILAAATDCGVATS